jgi:hypothetical protein
MLASKQEAKKKKPAPLLSNIHILTYLILINLLINFLINLFTFLIFSQY